MRIEYKANRMQRNVRESVGKALVANGIAREVEQPKTAAYQTRDMRAESEVDILRAECKRRGIKFHHRAGVAKLRALLKD